MSEEQKWAILYEDPDHGPEVFLGDGAEKAARETFAMRLDMWNCHLFGGASLIDDLQSQLAAERAAHQQTRTELKREQEIRLTFTIKCHQCGGTVIFKHHEPTNEIEFFHNCWSKSQREMSTKLPALQKQHEELMQIAALLVPLSTHGEGPVEIVTRLIAERDAARKDSERINWLNDQCEVDIWMRGNPDIDYLATVSCTDGRIITVDDCSTKSFQGATIREAIDAASAALAAKESSDGK